MVVMKAFKKTTFLKKIVKKTVKTPMSKIQNSIKSTKNANNNRANLGYTQNSDKNNA